MASASVRWATRAFVAARARARALAVLVARVGAFLAVVVVAAEPTPLAKRLTPNHSRVSRIPRGLKVLFRYKLFL